MEKAKYRLLSEWGNRVVYTNDEREKNSLLDKGFHIDEEWQKPEKNHTPAPKKRKVVKKDARLSTD